MIGEILTWAGVGIAALFAFLLYRSAERDGPPAEAKQLDTQERTANKKEAV